MRNLVKILIVVFAFAIGLYAQVRFIHADDSARSHDSTKDRERMMRGNTTNMADHCAQMMQGDSGSGRPNDQWRKGSAAPGERL